MKLLIKKEFGKHSYTDSLSPKIKPRYNWGQIDKHCCSNNVG